MLEKRPELRGLYAITPDEPDGAGLLRSVEAALAGGCRWLQYRDKISSESERLSRARALADLCRRHGAALIVNDDIALARTVSADGVHLGREDGSLADARAILGPDSILGASCYGDLEAARQAAAAGADYVAFGAVYPSPTKPSATSASIELFVRCRTEIHVPVCAIGGITLANAMPLITAGASLLAVITDLFFAPNISARSAAYQHLFEEKNYDLT